MPQECPMARFPQALGLKGSQRWIQSFVNNAPFVLDARIGLGPIDWRSPLESDDYAEYRDEAFLQRLGITLPSRSLSSSWPAGGPPWDALGRAKSGEVILVEAKAHLNELLSPPSAASESSLARIQLALRETASALGVPEGFDWSKQFYQYANRLAYAYFLHVVNGIPAKLAFVYFIGDVAVGGPSTRAAWERAIDAVHRALGLTTIPPFVVDVFIDVREEVG
jgi:hypothetical protein